MLKNIIKIFKKIVKKLKNTKGNSLAEFAVTTAMMATLATTAAPKFAGIGEAAKEKKTLANIDKIFFLSISLSIIFIVSKQSVVKDLEELLISFSILSISLIGKSFFFEILIIIFLSFSWNSLSE